MLSLSAFVCATYVLRGFYCLCYFTWSFTCTCYFFFFHHSLRSCHSSVHVHASLLLLVFIKPLSSSYHIFLAAPLLPYATLASLHARSSAHLYIKTATPSHPTTHLFTPTFLLFQTSFSSGYFDIPLLMSPAPLSLPFGSTRYIIRPCY